MDRHPDDRVLGVGSEHVDLGRRGDVEGGARPRSPLVGLLCGVREVAPVRLTRQHCHTPVGVQDGVDGRARVACQYRGRGLDVVLQFVDVQGHHVVVRVDQAGPVRHAGLFGGWVLSFGYLPYLLVFGCRMFRFVGLTGRFSCRTGRY